MFYQFVQREEMALDQAELPEADFHAKYAKIMEMKRQLEEQMEAIKGMTEEEKKEYMAKAYEKMVNTNLGGQPCCSDQSCPAHIASEAKPMDRDQNASTMSPAEQMAFFQNLGKQ